MWTLDKINTTWESDWVPKKRSIFINRDRVKVVRKKKEKKNIEEKILDFEDFKKLIDNENFYEFPETSKWKYLLLSVDALKKLREQGYNLSIVVKLAKDNTIRYVINKNVDLKLETCLKDWNIDLFEKFKIVLKDLPSYYYDEDFE